MEIRAGAPQIDYFFEIRHVDHERIALPMAARVAEPLAGGPMRPPVERDETCFVDHFRMDRDPTSRLKNIVIVVVRPWRIRESARDAPLPKAAVLPSIRGAFVRVES